MSKTVRIPVYTYGKYRAQDGTYEEFTDAKMRELVKNTNYVINSKAFIPAFGYVGYDHPVFGKVNDTDAHGHIKAAHYEDGVVSLEVLPIADRSGRVRLLEDAKAGRRPHVSGEHHNAFSFVDGDKTVHVGPTIVGLAALGVERPALKNPKIVPLSELEFPDTVPAAEAYAARETLRKNGFVAQTFSEGVLVFSEVQLGKDVDDPPKEQPMTAEDKAEFAKLLEDQRKVFEARIDEVKKDADTKITAMSEGAENKRKIETRVDTIAKEKKLGDIAKTALLTAALTPTAENVLAFGEKLSAVVLPGGSVRKEGEGGEGGDPDEPEALANLRPRHFSDMTRHESAIAAGVKAFGEYKPDAFKGIEKNLSAQIAKTRSYVLQRDVAN